MEDKIFNNDAVYMKSLIGKKVSIETVDKKLHQGFLYVIDPVYKTVVLIDDESKKSVKFVMYHAISSFQVLSDEAKEAFLKDFSVSDELSDTETRKLMLVRWLKQMLINVKDEGNLLKVEDHLVIEPPYRKENCMCDNTIVLERIQNIIDLMPHNL